MSELLDVPGVTVNLLPTGLFSGERARSMDDAFATFAWSNDQRIERLTGQRFTEQYRHRVLGDRQQLFDSGPATVALTAVSLTDPGQGTGSAEGHPACTLRGRQRRDVVGDAGRSSARRSVSKRPPRGSRNRDADLSSLPTEPVSDRAESLMQEFGARGVPTLIAESGAKRWMVNPSAAYSNPRALISQLEAV